jgi:hypothetical protein
MKSILLIICILFSINCFSQPQKADYKNLDQVSKLEFQNDYTRFCLKKYHDEKMIGYKCQLAGIIIVGASFIIPVPEDVSIYESGTSSEYTIHKKDFTIRTITSIGGGVISLLGVIINIDSEKWMKRAYIGPDGIGVRFKF